MANIIVGEKVINKAGNTGTIIAFDDNYITVDFKTRVVKLLSNAFEEQYLKYENPDLQRSITQARLDSEREAAEKQLAADNAKALLNSVQSELSRKHFKITLLAAKRRLEPSPLSLNSVRKKDVDLVQNIFNECDKDIKTLHESFKPDMDYFKITSYSRSKYAAAFLCKYLDTYVFRVFSRNDIYKKSSTGYITVIESDVTEVLRVFSVNGKVYYFSKNITSAGEYLVNTDSQKKWHVSKFNSSFLLNKITKNCDCGYINDYIEQKDTDCLQYLNLLFPAMTNNKAEIAFKNRLFTPAYRIGDVVSFLDQFTSKQIDFASKNHVFYALPLIKQYGIYDIPLLKDLDTVMKVRRNGLCIYTELQGHVTRLGFECPDLGKLLVAFLRKVERFDAALYYDYITELAERQDITLKDFFDKDYINRHYIMLCEKSVRHTKKQDDDYRQIARELSWIDREENDYFISIPKTIAEFKYEGDKQRHCVYTCRYYDLVIRRESIIVFLRKEPTVPFVTIEFDYETFEVLQAYTKYNTPLDRGLYDYIVDLGQRLRYEMLSQQ